MYSTEISPGIVKNDNVLSTIGINWDLKNNSSGKPWVGSIALTKSGDKKGDDFMKRCRDKTSEPLATLLKEGKVIEPWIVQDGTVLQ